MIAKPRTTKTPPTTLTTITRYSDGLEEPRNVTLSVPDGQMVTEPQDNNNKENNANEGEEEEEVTVLDTLAHNTTKLKQEWREERRLWERTRGNRQNYGIKWVKEILEATQIQENIVSAILTFAQTLISLLNELSTKERVVLNFKTALAKNGNMPLLPNSAPETELVTIEAVQGRRDFQQLSAEVQSRLDDFNRFFSHACHTNAG